MRIPLDVPLDSPEVTELLKLLGDVATRFMSSSDAAGVARGAFETLAERLGLEVYFNFLSDDDGGLELSSYAGVDEGAAQSVRHLKLGQAVCGTVAASRERLVAEAVQANSDDLQDFIRQIGVRAYACHPLLAGERLLGTLSFGTRTRDRFRAAELQLMAAVAEMAAIAIDRASLMARHREVNVDFDASGVDGLVTPSPVDSCVYRVIQEALNNVAKHAGAGQVGIVLTVENGWLHIVVEDDGVGFELKEPVDLLSKELGLIGIRERVALSGGTMMIESAPGQGTAMFVRLPLSSKPSR